jgi:hypothetical protein
MGVGKEHYDGASECLTGAAVRGGGEGWEEELSLYLSLLKQAHISASNSLRQVTATYGNITSSIRLLPESLFDFATRVMTADFNEFATKVDKLASLYLKTAIPQPGTPSADVFSAASLVQGLAHAVESVREVPSPLPPFQGPVDVADFAVFQTLEWLTNQTNPVSMQRAGKACVLLLDNVNTALSAGAFSFFYRCQQGAEWTTCPIHWTEVDVAPYIGSTSPAYQICKQIESIPPSFFSD